MPIQKAGAVTWGRGETVLSGQESLEGAKSARNFPSRSLLTAEPIPTHCISPSAVYKVTGFRQFLVSERLLAM